MNIFLRILAYNAEGNIYLCLSHASLLGQLKELLLILDSHFMAGLEASNQPQVVSQELHKTRENSTTNQRYQYFFTTLSSHTDPACF